ncbi:MAG TPA: hypothetical protein VGM54_09255 [Chthoniobacter sp.]
MKRLTFFILVFVLGCTVSRAAEKEKKHFVLYAMFLANTRVQLTEGSEWIMDKGDTFPLMMFKEHGTKVVLQLSGTSFITSAANVRVIEEKDITPEQLASYRTNVEHYLDGQAEKWKAAQAQGGGLGSGKAAPVK